MNPGYEIIKLLKLPENRLCADCQVVLNNGQNTFGSLTYGMWICSQCASIHKDTLEKYTKSSNVKKSTDNWTNNEVQIMLKAQHNQKINSILEKYIPSGWNKVTSTSTKEDKIQWIFAKYYSQYFLLPSNQLKPKEINVKNKRDQRIENIAVLPSRIVDYFLIIGPNKLTKGNPKQLQQQQMVDNIGEMIFTPDILDSYPKQDYYPDTSIPELVGSMVFPRGLRLSNQEKAPFSFTFVMTDINRVKLYGTTLIVYELLSYEQMKSLFQGTKFANEEYLQKGNYPILYAPKALTILSHYAFYQLYHKVLEQVYHVSLSSSPLPLERYIVNFMKELPLPPQGRIEVIYTLPEMVLQLSRPGKNQLPMVDFSYQPLFSMLSIDNILILFTALCMEKTICICCSNIALLTPVQEALLSLLFPFVWQGCYVPILPISMIELLDAPVPLLTGVHDSFLLQTSTDERPKNVFFVHLDTDSIFYERDHDMFSDTASVYSEMTTTNTTAAAEVLAPFGLLPLPKSKLVKLKAKLQEFGSSIYHKHIYTYQQAGYPFPENEHLAPIHSFLYEQGVLTQQWRGSTSYNDSNKSQKTGIRKITSPTGAMSSSSTDNLNGLQGASTSRNHAIPYHHPVACTLVSSESKNYNTPNSMLDPEFNVMNGSSFNAKEIREAFLRFFVACFIDYRDFLFVPEDNSNSSENSLKKRRSLLRTPDKSTQDLATLALASQGDNAMASIEHFNKQAYSQQLQDEFLSYFLNSQMFCNFISEHSLSMIANPTQISPSTITTQSMTPWEIIFFYEHILAKNNRSKFNLSKQSTPFLSDESEYLRETFTVPFPSTLGLPSDNTLFSYAHFPIPLNFSKHGYIPRSVKTLIIAPETKRLQLLNQSSLQQLIHAQEQALSQQSVNAPPPSSSSKLTENSTLLSSENKRQGIRLSPQYLPLPEEYKHFDQMKDQMLLFIHKIIRIQNWYLCHKYASNYNRLRSFILFSQYKIRKHIRIQQLLYQQQCQASLLIGSIWRMHRCYSDYQFKRQQIYKIQHAYRIYSLRKLFLRTKHACIHIQTRWRQYQLTNKFKQQLIQQIEQYRLQCFVLWILTRKSLIHRAYVIGTLFLPALSTTPVLELCQLLGMLRQELLTVYTELMKLQSQSFDVIFQRYSFQKLIVNSSTSSPHLSYSQCIHQFQLIFHSIHTHDFYQRFITLLQNKLVMTTSYEKDYYQNKYLILLQQFDLTCTNQRYVQSLQLFDTQQRTSLYEILREIKTTMPLDQWEQHYLIVNQKKRKYKLCQYALTHYQALDIQYSIQMLLNIPKLRASYQQMLSLSSSSSPSFSGKSVEKINNIDLRFYCEVSNEIKAELKQWFVGFQTRYQQILVSDCFYTMIYSNTKKTKQQGSKKLSIKSRKTLVTNNNNDNNNNNNILCDRRL